MRLLVCLVTSAVLLVPPAAFGQVRLGPRGPVHVQEEKPAETPAPPAPAERGPEVHRLTVTPAAEPVPALMHSFVPAFIEEKPGNAAPYYYRAMLIVKEWPKETLQPFWDNHDRWLGGTMEEFPKDEVRQFVNERGGFEGMLWNLRTAAYREHCDWDWRVRDIKGMETIAFLLPEVQEARNVARLLGLKIRLAIAEGRYDEAVETLRLGYQLARDVGHAPYLISNLVGVAIASMMSAHVVELIDAPGSPNLYWAISEFPQPLIDMRENLRYEMALPAQIFPFLQDAETVERSPEEWTRILQQSFEELQTVYSFETGSDWLRPWTAAALIAKGFPEARRDLIEAGYPAEQVDRMPVAQVVAIHQARVYQYMTQEAHKWWLLPYWQAVEKMRQSQEKLKREGYLGPPGTTREVLPIAGLFLPAVQNVAFASVRLEGRLAGLRAVEAVRMHAAETGRLPNSLDDIIAVPVPLNPITGKPFPYRLQEDTAVLDVDPGPNPGFYGWRFEITLSE